MRHSGHYPSLRGPGAPEEKQLCSSPAPDVASPQWIKLRSFSCAVRGWSYGSFSLCEILFLVRIRNWLSGGLTTMIDSHAFTLLLRRGWRRPSVLAAVAMLALSPPLLFPQDMRRVAEPRIPPTCTVLGAHLHATDGELSPSDERKLDTERIQQAIDHCSRGHAVKLQAKGGDQVFLTGPLHLRSGVTLVIAANTVLAGSRNPASMICGPAVAALSANADMAVSRLSRLMALRIAALWARARSTAEEGRRCWARN